MQTASTAGAAAGLTIARTAFVRLSVAHKGLPSTLRHQLAYLQVAYSSELNLPS